MNIQVLFYMSINGHNSGNYNICILSAYVRSRMDNKIVGMWIHANAFVIRECLVNNIKYTKKIVPVPTRLYYSLLILTPYHYSRIWKKYITIKKTMQVHKIVVNLLDAPIYIFRHLHLLFSTYFLISHSRSYVSSGTYSCLECLFYTINLCICVRFVCLLLFFCLGFV